MADRKAGHMPLGLGVPQRLVGLAEPGEQQRERLAFIVDDMAAASPDGQLVLEVDNAGAKAADVVISPWTIAGQMLAGGGRDVAQAADQPSGRAEIGRAPVCTPVTNAQLVCRRLLEQ